jgi:hypothetical protein
LQAYSCEDSSAASEENKQMQTPDPNLASALLVILETESHRHDDPHAPAIIELAWQEVADRLSVGANVNGWYNGETLLGSAVGWRRPDIVELLLENGARTNDTVLLDNGKFPAFTVVEETDDHDIVELLARYGANITAFNRAAMPIATGTRHISRQPVSINAHHLAKAQRGQCNPQPYWNPFYINQIRTFDSAYAGVCRDFADETSGCRRDVSPVFSFDRFGRSATRLTDGRLVLIAGEHEDSYDPDFFIYNDVCVVGEGGDVEYFIYPVEDFPPTDFHTATLVDNYIWIIGNLGYRNQRDERTTQVLQLNTDNWRMTRLDTEGAVPGWISRHSAVLDNREIVIAGGRREPDQVDIPGSYALNTRTLIWRKLP